jgi:hypothetical protein
LPPLTSGLGGSGRRSGIIYDVRKRATECGMVKQHADQFRESLVPFNQTCLLESIPHPSERLTTWGTRIEKLMPPRDRSASVPLLAPHNDAGVQIKRIRYSQAVGRPKHSTVIAVGKPTLGRYPNSRGHISYAAAAKLDAFSLPQKGSSFPVITREPRRFDSGIMVL